MEKSLKQLHNNILIEPIYYNLKFLIITKFVTYLFYIICSLIKYQLIRVPFYQKNTFYNDFFVLKYTY